MMNFVPLLVMNLLLLVITILLIIANRFLVTYGACKIVVSREDEQQEFTVQGGGTLLTYLNEHGIDVSSSCGGKGSCGYCKVRVLAGGGPILPTEEIYMSRQERAESMRLACQVKVKNDIEILIPNHLALVKEMVRTGKFDPNKRWKVIVS